MDARFLQTFVTVVQLGSIAEAARNLDLTPATVTQRLRALEGDVGCQLVVRSGRTVKPTIAGIRILDRAILVLREVRDLKSAASETDLPAGPLRLGVIPSVMLGIVPMAVKDWLKRYPHIGIYMDPSSTTQLYGKVLSYEIDAAILVHPTYELPKTCAWHPLREERLVLITPASMRVDDALETIAREPFICYDRAVVGGKMAETYLRQRGIRPQIRLELDGIEHIARLVAEGLGVSVVPDWSSIGKLGPAVKKWALPGQVPVRTVGVLWQRTTVRAPLVEALVEVLKPRFVTRSATSQ